MIDRYSVRATCSLAFEKFDQRRGNRFRLDFMYLPCEGTVLPVELTLFHGWLNGTVNELVTVVAEQLETLGGRRPQVCGLTTSRRLVE